MTLLLGGILAYVLLQVLVGLWAVRRVHSSDDYFVAGRSLPAWVVSVSICATWFGAETCVSASGEVYESGVSRFTVEPFAYGLCILLAGLLVAAPLWRRGITTTADLLRERFGGKVEAFAALLLIPPSVLWAAAQIRAFGHVLETSSTMELELCITLAAVFAILYTALGGLLADVVTDVVQGFALLLGLLVVAGAVLLHLGGPLPALEAAFAARAETPAVEASWWEVLEAWSVPVLGSLLAQEMLSRSLAARSAGAARGGTLLGGGLYLLIGLLPVFLGLVGAHLVPELERSEGIVPTLGQRYLPPLLYVVFAGALVSAILSTVDSALLVASAFLTRNLLLAGREQVSERWRLRWARLGVAGLGLVAWRLALGSEDVASLVEEASGFGSAGLLVVILAALFTRARSRAGAFGSLAGGALTWVVTRHFVPDYPLPYLSSLGVALVAFLGFGTLGSGWGRGGGARIA